MTPWISATDKPIQVKLNDEFEYTIESDVPFMAAVPLTDGKWWTQKCCISWGRLCFLIYDDLPIESGWEITDVTHYFLIEEPVK